MNNFDQKIIEEFKKLASNCYDWNCGITQEDIEQFILKSLQSQREMFMKCVPEKEEHYEGDSYMQYGEVKGWNDCCEEMLNNIKKI